MTAFLKLSVDRGHDLNHRRRKGDLVDIVFRVKGRDFACHRLLVSLYSPYLKTLITSDDFRERGDSVFELKEIDPVLFESVLDYIYTGSIVITRANVFNMVELCQYLQLEENHLMDACIHVMKDMITIKEDECELMDLMRVWNVTEEFNIATLRPAIFGFIERRAERLIVSDHILGFLGYKEIREILSRNLCLSNEKYLFDQLVDWCAQHVDDDFSLQMAKQLLSLVDLSVINKTYLRRRLDDFSSTSKSLIKQSNAKKRSCDKCAYVFMYHYDKSDILGIEEFVAQRSEESSLAVFHPEASPNDHSYLNVPSLFFDESSFFKHFGFPNSIRSPHLSTVSRYLVCLGGIVNSTKENSLSSNISIFDLVTKKWIPSVDVRNELPIGLVNFATVSDGGEELFVIGGLTDHANGLKQPSVKLPGLSFSLYTSSKIYKGNPREASRSKWKMLTEMPKPRISFSAIRVDSRIFIIGSNYCDIYDFNEDRWIALNNMPPGCGDKPVLAAIGTNILVFGNKPSQSPTNVCYALDVTELTWRSLKTLSLRQEVIGAFAHNNLAYVIGSQTRKGNMIHSFDPVSEQWKLVCLDIKGKLHEGTLIQYDFDTESFLHDAKPITFRTLKEK